MAVREIIRMGHPTLRQVAAPLTREEILSPSTAMLLEDMLDSMEHAGGIGLAAPQINVSKQVAIIGIPENSQRYPEAEQTSLLVVINPTIEVLDGETQGFWEGCLSVPDLRGFVKRPRKIKVSFLNQKAEKVEIEAEGFLATVFQHEIDHLQGKLYVDHITDMSLLSYLDEFEKFHFSPASSDENT